MSLSYFSAVYNKKHRSVLREWALELAGREIIFVELLPAMWSWAGHWNSQGLTDLIHEMLLIELQSRI